MNNNTPAEAGRTLEELEDVIDAGLETYIEVGVALMEIRDRKLYRATYSTFEAYCAERWPFGRRQANRLIMAAEVVAELGPIGPKDLTIIKPASEAVARELGRAPAGQRAAVWQKVVATAPEGKPPTAQHVKVVVAEYLPPPPATRPVVFRAPPQPADTATEEGMGLVEDSLPPAQRPRLLPEGQRPRIMDLLAAFDVLAWPATEENLRAARDHSDLRFAVKVYGLEGAAERLRQSSVFAAALAERLEAEAEAEGA